MKTSLFSLFLLTLPYAIFAQGSNSKPSMVDFSKLSFAEIDSLMYLKEAVEDLESCIYYMQGGRAKAQAAFGEQDSTFADYTAILGCLYQQTGQYKESEQFLIQARDIQAKVMGKKHPSYVASLNYLGELYNETVQYEKAETVLLEAHQIFEKFLGKEHPYFSENLNYLGRLYEETGNYEKAERIYFQANKILIERYGLNHPFFAQSLGRLAYVYILMGRYEKAEALLLQAKDIWAKTLGEESVGFGGVLNNLAGLYQDIGSFDKVEPLYLQTKNIGIKKFGENHPNTLPSFNNLARFYQNIGQYENAEVLYLKVMDIIAANNMAQHPSTATALNNFAGLYRLMGKYKEAEALYLQALDIRAKILGKDHPSYAISLSSFGVFCKEMGQLEKAKGLLLQAKNINFKTLGKEHPDYAQALSNLSGTYLELGHLDTALQYCYKSIDANSAQIDSNFKDWTNLDKYHYYAAKGINNSMMGLLEILKMQYQKTKDKSILEYHYEIAKTAMRLNEHIRNDFSGEGDKLRTLQSNTFFVKEGIKTALLLGKDTHQKEAFSFAELNKSILLADAVKGNRARALGDFPDTLVAKEIMLQTTLSNLKKQQYEAKTPEEKAQNNKDLVELNLEMDAFIKSIKDKYPKYHALKYENITAKATDIQVLLDDKTALLEYFLTDSVAYLFVVTKTGLELYPLPIPLEKIKTQIGMLRNTLSNYAFVINDQTKNYNQYTETAYWFFKELLEIGLTAATEDKSLENLIIVTDGELGHIPFEVFLLTPAPQKPEYKNLHYLIKEYNISYNYSSTLFVESQGEGKHNAARKNNGKILACAASYSQKDTALVSIREPYFTNLRKLLRPLPAAQTEIAALAESFQGDFLWNDSTNERFFKENAQTYGIIHLAMHGILEQKQPMLSSLVFTENRDSIDDNFLQAFEIAHLKLNADLVVLSACETGYGKFQQGEGVVSLARSFMYAGVPSLVVSLWQVNDHSTAVMMKLFYHNLANGMTKDAALRQAKLDYLKSADDITAHPAFWSPFIQLGDSRAVYLKTKTGWFWGIIGGIVLALGVGAFAMSSKKMN